jgi:hypothetical protein
MLLVCFLRKDKDVQNPHFGLKSQTHLLGVITAAQERRSASRGYLDKRLPGQGIITQASTHHIELLLRGTF